MPVDLFYRQSLLWIHRQQPSQQVSCLQAYIVVEGVVAVGDHFVEIGHVVSFEGHSPIQHCVQHHPRTPDVHVERVLRLLITRNYLWRNVCWSSALLAHWFDESRSRIFLTLLRHPKIRNLHISLSIQQDIIKFDVPMSNVLRMDIAQPINYLLEYDLCVWFFKSPSFPDVVEKVSSSAQLHHNYYVLVSFYRFVDLHHMIVPQLQQQTHLLHQLHLLLLVQCQTVFIQRLYSYKFSNKFVHGQVNFSKCASA
mmetsp:Transcript_9264/g.7059  ORF Transcript_9264/g.7059 Transcript_9264/m.7059 type:complete len:253 (+) Transcript_9264:183-941(+)